MGIFSEITEFLFGEPPKPDPLIGQSAMANAEVAKENLDFYKQVYYNDVRPRQQRTDAITERIVNQGLYDQQQASRFAEEQRDDYRRIYRPLEERVAQEAADYDSQGNINRRMGIASANVNDAFTNAREQSVRALQKYGLNPNSGAFAALNSRLTTQQALANAGARTGAAFDTMDKGIALRAGAVQTGRGMPNTSAQFMGISTNAGQGAAGANASATAQANQGYGVMGQGFQGAIQGNTAAGNLAAQKSGLQMQGYGMGQETMGSLVGAGATLGAAAMMMSSKKAKDRNESIDPHDVLDRVRGLKVDAWSYKGDGQRHIGPYAEDLHQKFGVGNGEAIGQMDPGGIALAAVKALADDMDQIKGALGISVPGRKQEQRGVRVQ